MSRREHPLKLTQMANAPPSDAEDTRYVYAWRSQQEVALRDLKGTGMTDEQVVKFVDGCKNLPVIRTLIPSLTTIQTTRPMSCTQTCSDKASFQMNRGGSFGSWLGLTEG